MSQRMLQVPRNSFCHVTSRRVTSAQQAEYSQPTTQHLEICTSVGVRAQRIGGSDGGGSDG